MELTRDSRPGARMTPAEIEDVNESLLESVNEGYHRLPEYQAGPGMATGSVAPYKGARLPGAIDWDIGPGPNPRGIEAREPSQAEVAASDARQEAAELKHLSDNAGEVSWANDPEGYMAQSRIDDSFPGATQPLALDFIDVLQGNDPAELIAAAQPVPGSLRVIAAGAEVVFPDSERKVKAAGVEEPIPDSERTVVMNPEHKAYVAAMDEAEGNGRESSGGGYDR